eukprot:scaffold76115_cov58-Phaeocystis_antarctica.AAC.1
MSAPLSVAVLLELYYYSSRAGCCKFDATVLYGILLVFVLARNKLYPMFGSVTTVSHLFWNSVTVQQPSCNNLLAAVSALQLSTGIKKTEISAALSVS